MAMVIPDAQIAEMIAETKPLSLTWRQGLAALQPRPANYESSINLVGCLGTRYRIVVRKHRQYQTNFCILLLLRIADNLEFPLLRYDGNSHRHKNKIEGNWIDFKFHIHRATERYQITTRGTAPDGFAFETENYQDLPGAWSCFFGDVNLKLPEGNQQTTLPHTFTQV